MFLGRVLVEEFQADVREWLRQRAEVVVLNPWIEPERWDHEAPRVDAVISRKGRITREHIEESRGRLKIIARTGVGVDPSRVDLVAARQYKIWGHQYAGQQLRVRGRVGLRPNDCSGAPHP